MIILLARAFPSARQEHLGRLTLNKHNTWSTLHSLSQAGNLTGSTRGAILSIFLRLSISIVIVSSRLLPFSWSGLPFHWWFSNSICSRPMPPGLTLLLTTQLRGPLALTNPIPAAPLSIFFPPLYQLSTPWSWSRRRHLLQPARQPRASPLLCVLAERLSFAPLPLHLGLGDLAALFCHVDERRRGARAPPPAAACHPVSEAHTARDLGVWIVGVVVFRVGHEEDGTLAFPSLLAENEDCGALVGLLLVESYKVVL